MTAKKIIHFAIFIVLGCNDKPEIIQPGSQLYVFPNPATDLVNIQVNNPSNYEYDLSLFDTEGEPIFEIHDTQPTSDYSVTLSDKPKGTYQVVYKSNGSKIITKLIKI